jgi:hypothetical protein
MTGKGKASVPASAAELAHVLGALLEHWNRQAKARAKVSVIVRDNLAPLNRLLQRWQLRMRQTGFPDDDRLYRQTLTAYEAACDLTMKFHRIADPTAIRIDDRPTESDRRSRANG